MSRIAELSSAILILIRAGAVFRIAFICFQMVANEDEIQMGKKRIKNTLKFYVIAESVFIIKSIIMYYF